MAVERTLERDEAVESTVYLHVVGAPSMALLTGLPVNIRTWIAVLTDRRVIVLKGNEVNAARSEMVGAFPRDAVTVVSAEPAEKPKQLELLIRDQGSLRFEVPLIWREDAAAFAASLAG